ncbi:MAG: phenylacetic acid degradation bifunctional protein PaaZ, partial [Microlunatus sp.]|nr:phenylacetic acid degradation bifunctional protein PaaZ [Microlunatus sp.]
DFGKLIRHSRDVGGCALRELTFRRRAAMMEALAAHLSEHKQELYDLSARAGYTQHDATFDVDGGIHSLLVHARKGKVELPDDTMLLDGEVERLSRRGSFVAQHVCVPLRGAAVHINAFNFPVWGLLEKLAPALIAGVPVIAKPASSTAFITYAVVRHIVDSQILPAGALQLICGGVGDLFEHLTGQDVVCFTGSAETAEQLRSHPTIVSQSVRFNTEADSLNAAILGPDATPDTEEFGLFVAEVVAEMTQKAGQKCTAIRRAFVPRSSVPAALEAIGQALSQVRVGDPSDPSVTMGPLVSLSQRTSVRAAVGQLLNAAELAFGQPDTVEVVGADAERGAFMSPVLLWCSDASRAEPHQIEAFGPVCTVLPYDSVDEIAELAARGEGSLVATLVTHDVDVARRMVADVAAYHGRLLVLDRTCGKESTGHGAALSQLVHGGPGRAGGGEELGGLRGLRRYLQRTAVQGSPDMLTAISGRWVVGAERHTDGEHPFRKYLEDLRLGDAVIAGPRTITLDDIDSFAALTGDIFYAHMDEEAARANPFFEGRVAHGYLLLAVAAGLFVEPSPGPVLANYGIDGLRFLKPVNPGDAVTVTLTAKQIRPRKGYGEVSWDAVVTNQDGDSVAEYDVLTMVANRPAG